MIKCFLGNLSLTIYFYSPNTHTYMVKNFAIYFENLVIGFHFFFFDFLNMHVKFCINQILFTIHTYIYFWTKFGYNSQKKNINMVTYFENLIFILYALNVFNTHVKFIVNKMLFII